MKKTAFFLAFLALTAFAVSAQRFDWATGFGSSHEGCLIKGTVTDDEGNLYLLGQFPNDATWEGHRLLPIAPYGPGANSVAYLNTLIAKVSPDGRMLWKKVIHSNNNQRNMPYDIKKVGDTAFACLMELTLPSDDNYTYYLDTLLPTWSDYPVEAWGMDLKVCNAYLLFDFEGNVLEQHFLQLTYTDTAGNDILRYFDGEPWYRNNRYVLPSFDVDAGGNIYITRIASDYLNENYTSQNGAISSVKFWVDRRLAGTCAVENRPMQWFPQLLKFSPHFDTLLDSRYVVQKCDSVEYTPEHSQTILDANGNLYFLNTQGVNGRHSNTIIFDSLQGISYRHSDTNITIGYIIKYNSLLSPQYILYLKDSITGDRPPSTSRIVFRDMHIDMDSALLFFNGFTQKDKRSTSTYRMGTTPLDLEKNDAFIISANLETGEIHTSMVIPSTSSSNLGTYGTDGNLFAQNNRIFIQNQYFGGIVFPNQTIRVQESAAGLCLTMFDYSGNLITGIDYNTLSPRNCPGSIALVDSVLFLSNTLYSDATFGNISFPVQGGQSACIAKYVDTAFMTPYVYTGDTSDVRITVVDDEGAFVVYPNPFRQRVTIKVEGGEPLAETAWLTDFTGRQEQVRLTAEGTGRYSLDLTARPQASYLLTLTTVSGKTHTLRLLKQSDVFAQ